MKCPLDQAELVMSERQGVEIDYCPTCRGVWLDRGEIDKIIERSANGLPQSSSGQSTNETLRRPDYQDDRYHDDKHRHPHKKRESFLSDLFDF